MKNNSKSNVSKIANFANTHRVATAVGLAAIGGMGYLKHMAHKNKLTLRKLVKLNIEQTQYDTKNLIKVIKTTATKLNDENYVERNERLKTSIDNSESKGMIEQQANAYLKVLNAGASLATGAIVTRLTGSVIKLGAKALNVNAPSGLLGAIVSKLVSGKINKLFIKVYMPKLQNIAYQAACNNTFDAIIEQQGEDSPVVTALCDGLTFV